MSILNEHMKYYGFFRIGLWTKKQFQQGNVIGITHFHLSVLELDLILFDGQWDKYRPETKKGQKPNKTYKLHEREKQGNIMRQKKRRNQNYLHFIEKIYNQFSDFQRQGSS